MKLIKSDGDSPSRPVLSSGGTGIPAPQPIAPLARAPAPAAPSAAPPSAFPPPVAAFAAIAPLAQPQALTGAQRGVIKQQVVGAYSQAKEILGVAEQEAARIIAEAERIREEQAKLGFDEGWKQGYDKALERLAEIELEHARVFEGLEPKLVALSVRVAEKIIGAELAARPDAIVAIVAQALKTVRHQREVNVRVNPAHVAAVEERKKVLLGVLSRARDVTIRGDPGVREGGCIIETELGILDADLGTQLEILGRALGGDAGSA